MNRPGKEGVHYMGEFIPQRRGGAERGMVGNRGWKWMGEAQTKISLTEVTESTQRRAISTVKLCVLCEKRVGDGEGEGPRMNTNGHGWGRHRRGFLSQRS